MAQLEAFLLGGPGSCGEEHVEMHRVGKEVKTAPVARPGESRDI